ncbi:hypothetical protein BT96DRAFT_179176 [Gymnopus androsaceus JB14]|uniref:Uncharacterized protein n=1 Tax=Gymnopus androsaceus JB14 TaxID=1447944 RepID=A0A6A4H948_9AGAR|nr:hypothetical protein BT96DRAFT_179176 [Gymnopus androsaceus JB14]
MHSLCICILFGFRFMLYSTLLPTVHSFSHAFVFCPSFCFVYITRYIVQLSGLALRCRRHCPLCSLSSWSFGVEGRKERDNLIQPSSSLHRTRRPIHNQQCPP